MCFRHYAGFDPDGYSLLLDVGRWSHRCPQTFINNFTSVSFPLAILILSPVLWLLLVTFIFVLLIVFLVLVSILLVA